jgi:heme/copper-type cytochrome/quinol oxidase subunit 2
MSTYAILMAIGIPLVVGGWIAYFLWDYKQRKEEEQRPKPQSAHLQKTKSEMADWAKKMAEFKSPAPKRPADNQGT